MIQEELVETFLENSKLIDINAIWYVTKVVPESKVVGFMSSDDYVTNDKKTMVKTILPSYFRKKRKSFYEKPTEFIHKYKRDKPSEFIDFDYESNSWYVAYQNFIATNKVWFYCNFHATFAYYSVMDHMYHTTNVKFKVNLVSFECIDIHIGTWVSATGLVSKKDIMAELVFDDLEYLKNNIDKDFLQKVFLKYLNG